MQKVKIMTGLIGLMMIGAVVGCSKSDNNEPTTESVLSLQQERTDDIDSGQVLDVSSDTGDVFHITINNKRTNTISYNNTDKTLSIIDDKEQKLGTGCFITAKWYKKYYDAVNQDCKILGSDSTSNINYIYYSYENSTGEEVNEILGWIIGSNTGFVFESTQDMTDVRDCFSDLWFEINETDQQDNNFILDPNTVDNTDDESLTFSIGDDKEIVIDTEE